jgi:hypothetical protein
MFDDENEEEMSKPSIVSAKINEKSNDLNNKLSMLLANEKENKTEQKKNIFDDEPKQVIKETTKTLNTSNTNQILNPAVSNLSSTVNNNNPKQSIKRPIFLDDDEEDLVQPVQKKPEKRVTIIDPLSSMSNSQPKPKKNISNDPLSMMAEIMKSTKKDEKQFGETEINSQEKEPIKEEISSSEIKVNLTEQLSDLKFTLPEEITKVIEDVNILESEKERKSSVEHSESQIENKIESKSQSHIEESESESIKKDEISNKPTNKFGDLQNVKKYFKKIKF